jgi:hypothetical protein
LWYSLQAEPSAAILSQLYFRANMRKQLLHIVLMILVACCQTSCFLQSMTHSEPERAIPADGCATLAKIPFQEAWYGMYYREDKIGYSHFKIEPDGKDFTIKTDSLMRLTAMKKTSEVAMKEDITVRPDLTLISFESAVTMNGQRMKMIGREDGTRLLVDITVDGEKRSREYPIEGKLYHCSAVSFMPVMHGLKDGRQDSFRIFNPEKQGFDKVDQELFTVKGDAGPSGAVWKVRNQYGRAQVVAWLNNKGLTVVEKSLEGSMLTVLEDEASAKSFLEKKTSSKDLVLDLSLIKVAKEIPGHEKLRYLKVRMQGIDPTLIGEDLRQKIATPAGKSSSDGFDVTVQSEDPAKLQASARTSQESVSDTFLASTVTIQADHAEIVEQAKKIVSPRDSDFQKVTKLVNWVAANIKNDLRDSLTALSVLRNREGECQAHANLYTALARSLGIPTRVVTGIVYTKHIGFLYHAWAESFIGGWLAVDPTFRQVPADATHIRIASDDSGDISQSLHKMIGKVKMEVLEYR